MSANAGCIEHLLDAIKSLPVQVEPESTIFSIGGRGHFENPTTDLLAFFCDVNADHNLGNLVLSALLESIGRSELNARLRSKPEREVRTATNKRIDLLLEGDRWVLALENKITHLVANPFEEYEQYVLVESSTRFRDKAPIFVLLSPDGVVPPDCSRWLGVSYESLIAKLKPKLADSFVSRPLNKWLVLLREFVLHLEGMLVRPKLVQENMKFVMDNYQAIKRANQLKEEVFEQCQQELKVHLAMALTEEVLATRTQWDDENDAIRFELAKWSVEVESDVVVFMDPDSPSGMAINLYIMVNDDSQASIVDGATHPFCPVGKWSEKYDGDTYACYKFYPFNDSSLETLKVELEKIIRLLDDLETRLRT